MPIPIAPLIGAGLSIGSGLINRQWRRKEEKGRRAYEKTQELDRRLYDQLMWDKVNKYNHPLQQMSRLTDAGLNPNLIYGSSPGSAVGNAQSIAQGKQLQGMAPQYQIDNPMTPFMDTKVKQAQTDNLKADVFVKATQAQKNMKQAGKTDWEIKLAQNTFDDKLAISGANKIITQVKAEVDRRSRVSKVLQQFTKTNKDELMFKMLELEFKYMKGSNQLKGYTVGNFASALGMPLNTQQGRESFSIVSTLAAGSRVFGYASAGLKSLIQAGKSMFGKVAKHTKKFYKRKN
jgi:hypothetical protein